MWGHAQGCGCPVCSSLSRIFALISAYSHSPGFVPSLGDRLRVLEGQIRDEWVSVLQHPPPRAQAEPAAGDHEREEGLPAAFQRGAATPPVPSQTEESPRKVKEEEGGDKEAAKEGVAEVTTKETHGTETQKKRNKDRSRSRRRKKKQTAAEGAVESPARASGSKASKKAEVVEERTKGASSPRSRKKRQESDEESERSKGVRSPSGKRKPPYESEEEEEDKGAVSPRASSSRPKGGESPRDSRRRKDSPRRSRREKRRSESSERGARSPNSRGGKEKKRRPERPPEPANPPSAAHLQGLTAAPKKRSEGWRGAYPTSTHPRWSKKRTKGITKVIKQEYHDRRRYSRYPW